MNEITRRAHLDHGEREITFEIIQDVEDILERNKWLQSEQQKSDWCRHVASIPNVILTRWLNEEHARGNTTLTIAGPEMDALIQRKLRDPEWRYLRTA